MLSEHVFTQSGLLLAIFRTWKMLLLSVSFTKVLPSQTSLLVQNSGLAAGILLPSTFGDWEAAICFLSLSAEKIEVYLIWRVESRSGTKITIALHLSSFPLSPQELCFCVCHHFQSSHLPHHSWSSSAFGSQVLLGLWAWSDETKDAHSAHCYCQCQHWQWERKG